MIKTNTLNFRQEPANAGHMYDLSLHMSKADINELVAAGRLHSADASPSDIESILLECPMERTYAIVSKYTGVTYAVGGVTAEGVVWFLCSKYVENFSRKMRKQFLWMLKDNLEAALRVFPEIHNVVWAGNKKHVALLRYLGAIFEGYYKCNGEFFIRFHFEGGLNRVNWGG